MKGFFNSDETLVDTEDSTRGGVVRRGSKCCQLHSVDCVERFRFEISVQSTFAGTTTAESLGTIHVHFASISLLMIHMALVT